VLIHYRPRFARSFKPQAASHKKKEATA